MTLSIDVSPQVGARFTALAHQSGIEPAALFETMVRQYTPDLNISPPALTPKFTPANDPLMARLEASIAAAPTDPESIREAEEDMLELMRNLNANRRATGERIPFPEVE
ncbi:MAG: hypothetical protein ACLQVD_20710 [Capsulimonadaceae bacterium]